MPGQPQKSAPSRGLQRQPSGTARTRAVAAQMHSQPPLRSLQRQQSRATRGQAIHAQSQMMMNLTRSLDRQPSRTSAMQALPAQPATGRTAAAADSPKLQHEAAPATDVMISPKACPSARPSHHNMIHSMMMIMIHMLFYELTGFVSTRPRCGSLHSKSWLCIVTWECFCGLTLLV